MHEHDLDLVAALTADPAGEARRWVESCPECAGELRRQLAVREEVARLPVAIMTDDELRTLRVNVKIELERGARVFGMPRQWAALGSVAAGLLVVVGIGNLLGQLGSSAEGVDSLASASRLATETTGAPAATADLTFGAELVPSDEKREALDLGEIDLARFISRLGEERARLDEEQEQLDGDASIAAPAGGSSELPCADQVSAPGPTVITATVDGVRVVAFRPPGEPGFLAFRIDDCLVFPLD